MDRNEFINLLKREGIDPELVAFDRGNGEGNWSGSISVSLAHHEDRAFPGSRQTRLA